MNRLFNGARLVALGLLILPLLSMPAFAAHVFHAEMTGDQEVVPSGSTAFGMATLIMDDAMTQIAYTVNFVGLDAPLTSCAFFLGGPDEVGTEVMDLPGPSPMAGIWYIDEPTATALMEESLYINVFTDPEMFPDGEIRGNFTLALVGDEPSSLDRVKALYR